jgi:hypothetical protein
MEQKSNEWARSSIVHRPVGKNLGAGDSVMKILRLWPSRHVIWETGITSQKTIMFITGRISDLMQQKYY